MCYSGNSSSVEQLGNELVSAMAPPPPVVFNDVPPPHRKALEDRRADSAVALLASASAVIVAQKDNACASGDTIATEGVRAVFAGHLNMAHAAVLESDARNTIQTVTFAHSVASMSDTMSTASCTEESKSKSGSISSLSSEDNDTGSSDSSGASSSVSKSSVEPIKNVSAANAGGPVASNTANELVSSTEINDKMDAKASIPPVSNMRSKRKLETDPTGSRNSGSPSNKSEEGAKKIAKIQVCCAHLASRSH